MASRDVNNTNRRYRRILRNFGGSDSIQGLEDAPIDPDKEDAKFVGLTVLLGGTILAVTPQDMIAMGWIGAGLVVALAGVAMYICPDERAPIEWMSAIGRFKRAPKRLTNHAEKPEERTQTLTQVERILPMSGAAERRDGALVGLVEVKGKTWRWPKTPPGTPLRKASKKWLVRWTRRLKFTAPRARSIRLGSPEAT